MSDVFEKPKDPEPSSALVSSPAPKKRKPMSEEAKAKARENLKKAREVRAAKNVGKKVAKEEKKAEKVKKEKLTEKAYEDRCKETLSELMSQNDRLKSDLKKAVQIVRDFEAKSKAKSAAIAPKDVKMEYIPVETLEKFRRSWVYE